MIPASTSLPLAHRVVRAYGWIAALAVPLQSVFAAAIRL